MQATYTKRKLEKIYKQVDKLALKGKDQIYEYYKLVDDIIQKGDYGYLEQCFYYYYKIDLNRYSNIDDVKSRTWPEILFQTSNSLSRKIKALYDSKEVYQTGIDIYNDGSTSMLIDLSSPMSYTYSVITTTQSITLFATQSSVNTDPEIFIDVDGPLIYKIEIMKATWSTTPSDLRSIQTINVGTSSTIYQTDIPTSYGREYLIRLHLHSNQNIINYRLIVSKNVLLGQLEEVEIFNQDAKYYIYNKEFAKLMKDRKFYLKLTKESYNFYVLANTTQMVQVFNIPGTYSLANDICTWTERLGPSYSIVYQRGVTFSNDPYNMKEDQNLLNKYRIAIDYLLL